MANIQRANFDFFLVPKWEVERQPKLRICVCVCECICVSQFQVLILYAFDWVAHTSRPVMSHAELKLIIAMQHNLLCHTVGRIASHRANGTVAVARTVSGSGSVKLNCRIQTRDWGVYFLWSTGLSCPI